jgi:hypothetical protein
VGFRPQTMRVRAAQAGEMVIRCSRRIPGWRLSRPDHQVGIRPEEDGMTVTTPNMMRSLVVQERETLHHIVERLLPRSPSYLPSRSRPPSSADTAICSTAVFGTSSRC